MTCIMYIFDVYECHIRHIVYPIEDYDFNQSVIVSYTCMFGMCLYRYVW